jgi:glutamyl-tRNA reductase
VPSTPNSEVHPPATPTDLLGSTDPGSPVVAPLALIGLEFSLDTASLDALEAVAQTVTRDWIAERFAVRSETEEVALLSTCHRVELILLAQSRDAAADWQRVLPGAPGGWRVREGRELVQHLFRVAAGRESLAVGEAEVRHQVRSAAANVRSRHPRPILRQLFARAASAADEGIRPETLTRSIAAIAASRLLSLCPASMPRVLVVGSGTVGRQVTESLSRHAHVTVAFHSRAPDQEFLRANGARSLPLERLGEQLPRVDAVVTAAKFGHRALRAEDLPRDHPLVLVDLGVPRNIDPEARRLSNVRLVDLEELHGLARVRSPGGPEDFRVAELAVRFSEELDALLWEPSIDAFRRAAEEVRRSELARARSHLGGLAPEQEVAIERLTRRLVARLLLPPTERIRSLPAGPEGASRRRFAVELLTPNPADS